MAKIDQKLAATAMKSLEAIEQMIKDDKLDTATALWLIKMASNTKHSSVKERKIH